MLDAATGAVTDAWANDMFYMPHMLTVNNQGKVWVTDVGLHQVFKFDPQVSKTKPVLTLGTEVSFFRETRVTKPFGKPVWVLLKPSCIQLNPVA